MEEVTGRDNQIICQALQIAIPVMLKNSLSASNVEDMMRILDARGNLVSLKLQDHHIRTFLENVISDLNSEKSIASEQNSEMMQNLITRYLQS